LAQIQAANPRPNKKPPVICPTRPISSIFLMSPDGFARTWQRPPSKEELQGLVDDYIRDEVLSPHYSSVRYQHRQRCFSYSN
jgi:hypothetical protein